METKTQTYTTQDKISILQKMPLLKNCSDETIQRIAHDTYHRSYEKNSFVMSSETAIHRIAIVANTGRMKISATNQKNGEEYIAYILTYGDIFNVTTFFDGEKDHLQAEAIDNIEILHCNIDISRDWINSCEDFNKNLLGYLTNRLRMVQKFNVNRTFYSIEIRLARLIFDNVVGDKNKLNLINDLSHEEIAKLLGTSRAVVNRNLQKLKADHLIDIKRKKILIEDYEKMRDYIEEQSYF